MNGGIKKNTQVTFRKTAHLRADHPLIWEEYVWALAWKITFPSRPQSAFLQLIHYPLSPQVALVCHNCLPLRFASWFYVNKLSMFNSQASTVTRCRTRLIYIHGLHASNKNKGELTYPREIILSIAHPWYKKKIVWHHFIHISGFPLCKIISK